MEAKTERELIIQMDGKLTRACEAIERCAASIEKLEIQKVNSHEIRLVKIEKWMNEWGGAYRLMAIAALVVSVFGTLITIYIKTK